MGNLDPAPPAVPTEPPPGDRLNSWKEIGAYLKRDVRTLHRWEAEEGLPIHRHLHKKRGSVFAYRSELEGWWSERRVRLDKQPTAPTKRWDWGKVATASLVVLLILGPSVYFFRQRAGTQEVPDRKIMLAVLPFENLGGNPDQEYFSDGLTEEMIAQLGNLNPQRLGVIARASAMQYKHSSKGAAQIGRELGVDYLLEGSARRADGRVRITAQLIQVSDQTHLWAESYEGDLRDILVLQRDVAATIAQQIRLTLSADTRARLAQQRPVNPEAHEAYLRGLYFWNKFNIPALNKSLEYFQQAIDKDPGYAHAYAGLSASYGILGNMRVLPPREAYPKAAAAARKALEIDEGLSEAHGELGWVTLLYQRDWAGAEREFRRAIELNPSNANARDGLSMYLVALGRFDEALAEIRHARDLDPLSLIINVDAGFVLFFARQYDQAIEQLQKTREIDPNFPLTYLYMGHVYEARGMEEEAYQMYFKSMTLAETIQPEFRVALGQAHAKGGWRGAWQKAADLRRRYGASREDSGAYVMAEYCVRLGDKNQALDSLLEAADERFYLLVFANVDPRFDGLRSDPRFSELLRRIGLPQ